MYIFFSSSNTWSNVCMIYGCDIYNCDITISADTTFTSAPANQPQIERCDSAMIAEEEVSTNLIFWVSLHFEEKSVSAYRRIPRPTVQNTIFQITKIFFWALITICMFDQVFEASYLQPIVLVQISHFIHKAVLITLTRQFNNILVIFFKSTRMISLSPIISIVTQQNL